MVVQPNPTHAIAHQEWRLRKDSKSSMVNMVMAFPVLDAQKEHLPKTFWGSSPFMFSSLLQESFQNFSPKKDGAVKMSIVLVVANIIQTPLREVSQINPQ